MLLKALYLLYLSNTCQTIAMEGCVTILLILMALRSVTLISAKETVPQNDLVNVCEEPFPPMPMYDETDNNG